MRSAILTTNALPAACHGLPRTSGTCRRSFQSRPVGAGVAGGCPQILTVHLTLYNQGEQIIPTTSILAPTLDFQTFLRPCEDPKAVHLERNSLHCTSAWLPRAPPLPRRCLHCAAVVYLSSIDSVMVNFSWPLTRPIT